MNLKAVKDIIMNIKSNRAVDYLHAFGFAFWLGLCVGKAKTNGCKSAWACRKEKLSWKRGRVQLLRAKKVRVRTVAQELPLTVIKLTVCPKK